MNCDKHHTAQHTHLTTDFSTTLTSSMMLVGVNDSATNHRSSSRKRSIKATNNSWLSKREKREKRQEVSSGRQTLGSGFDANLAPEQSATEHNDKSFNTLFMVCTDRSSVESKRQALRLLFFYFLCILCILCFLCIHLRRLTCRAVRVLRNRETRTRRHGRSRGECAWLDPCPKSNATAPPTDGTTRRGRRGRR